MKISTIEKMKSGKFGHCIKYTCQFKIDEKLTKYSFDYILNNKFATPINDIELQFDGVFVAKFYDTKRNQAIYDAMNYIKNKELVKIRNIKFNKI